jgi:hypothetical protein
VPENLRLPAAPLMHESLPAPFLPDQVPPTPPALLHRHDLAEGDFAVGVHTGRDTPQHRVFRFFRGEAAVEVGEINHADRRLVGVGKLRVES